MDAVTRTPVATNEPIRSYAPGSAERASLETRLGELASERIDLTCTIGGVSRMGSGESIDVVQPHARHHVLGTLQGGTHDDAVAAMAAAKAAAPAWRDLSFDDRAAIFLKAADLLSGPWRDTLNAATMLGQSKTCYQAEIDSACELIDFWRFNVGFARRLLEEQPISSPGVWNRLDHRPLEGVVYAITPFNFTAIAGNLPTAPALMGNVVVWKPAHGQQLAAHHLMAIFEEAGLPPGVINMVTGHGVETTDVVLADPEDNELCVIAAGNRFLADTARVGAVNCDGTHAVGVFWSQVLGWPLGTVKTHLARGKDNLRQQSAMWQAMLMSAGLPNSKQIITAYKWSVCPCFPPIRGQK